MSTVRITPQSGSAFLVELPGSNALQMERMKTLRARLTADTSRQSSGMIFSCMSSTGDDQMTPLKLFALTRQNPETESLLEESKKILGPDAKITYLKPVLGFSRTLCVPPSPHTATHYFWIGTYIAYPGKRNRVLQYLSQFADDIVGLEPETLNYIALISDDAEDEDTLYLWEEYADERGLREVHMTSKAAAGLKDTIGPLLRDRAMAGFVNI